jgi:hypothetical protein
MRRESLPEARPVAAALAAGVGAAVAAAIASLPPGAGHGRLGSLTGEVLGSPVFWVLLPVVAAASGVSLFLLARATVRREDIPFAEAWAVWEPLAWGASAPIFALLIDPWSFSGSSGVLALAGLGLGVLVVMHRHGRLARAAGCGQPEEGSDRQPSRLVIASLAVAIPTLVVAMGPAWWPALSGDEPHYLLYARSIAVDRDIDLGADYDEGGYRSFYPPDLPPHTKPGADPSSRYSTHGIGLPLLLVPWYGVAGSLAVAPFTVLMRFTMALWLGAFAFILFELLRDIAGEKAARRGTLVTVLTGPLLFIAPHLFPDLPAMTLSAGAYLILCRSRSPGGAFAAGLLVALLPWLGVKFIAMATALAVVGCLMLRRSTSRPAARAAAYLAPIAASALGHLTFTWVLYGRLSPLALYHGGSATDTRAVGQSESLMAYLIDYDGAIRTGIGLFLDQKHGLLLFAPHFLLAVAGFAWLWRRRRSVFWFLLPVFAAHWAAHAVSQELSGWSTPGRPLVGALWTLAIPMGVALALSQPAGRAGGFFAAARGALVALGIGVTALLMAQPHLLYHDFGVGRSFLLSRYGAPGLPLWKLFPQWVLFNEPQWVASFLWLIGAIVAGVLLWRWALADRPEPAATEGRPGDGYWAAGLVVILSAIALLLRGALVPTTGLHQGRSYGAVTVWSANGLIEEAWAEADGVWLRGRHAQTLQISSAQPIEVLTVELSALVDVDAQIQVGRERDAGGVAPGAPMLLRLAPQRGRRWQGEQFYLLGVEASGGASPSELGIDPGDRRLLGLYLRILDAQIPDGS